MSKVIIAGSRDINNYQLVLEAIDESGFNITEVVSGGCRGVDKIGEVWAKENSLPIKIFEANWNLYGKSAGPRRNLKMAEYADALICIYKPNSRGSKNIIRMAKEQGLKIFAVEI